MAEGVRKKPRDSCAILSASAPLVNLASQAKKPQGQTGRRFPFCTELKMGTGKNGKIFFLWKPTLLSTERPAPNSGKRFFPLQAGTYDKEYKLWMALT